MEKIEWEYYHHALIPTTAPHENADYHALEELEVWKNKWGGFPLLARWTSDFDCGRETNWWYTIRNGVYDISQLKSKRRNVVNKGIKNFIIKPISTKECVDDIYKIQIAAYSAYPEKYRPDVSLNSVSEELRIFERDIANKKKVMLGAYYIENGSLQGYLVAGMHHSYVSFNILRTNPEYERLQINAALVNGLLEYFSEDLKNPSFYICDGERSINHETQFQDYLEKYFGFRKAYCNLHIKYRPGFERLFKVLYRFRNVFLNFDQIGIFHQLNAVLKMEAYVRNK